MVSTVDLEGSKIMDDATGTARQYLLDAVEAIDRQFGPGYAKKNPALISTYMRVAAQDASDAMLLAAAETIQRSAERLAESLRPVG